MEPYIRFNVGEKAREQWVSAAHATAAQPLFAPRMTNSAARPNPPTTRISRSLSAAWRRSSAVTMQQKNNKQSDTTPFTLFWRSCCIYFILFAAVKSGENSRLDMFSRDQGYLLQWLFLSPSLWFFYCCCTQATMAAIVCMKPWYLHEGSWTVCGLSLSSPPACGH